MRASKIALLLFCLAPVSGAASEDYCNQVLNRFWSEVVFGGYAETADEKAANHEIIRSLLEQCEGVTPYFQYEGDPGGPEGKFSIALFAIYLDDLELFKDYVSEGHPIDGLPNPMSDTSVSIAVHRRSATVLPWLIEQGVDVNLADDFGITPLMLAAGQEQSGMNSLALLIDAGADVNATVPGGRSALGFALWAGQLDNARFLMVHGADVEQARAFLFEEIETPRSDQHLENVEQQLALLDQLVAEAPP